MMSNNRPSPLRSRGAFTLVEILVAGAVFAILAGLLLQVFGSLTASTSSSQARSEALRQAIGALERVDRDLAGFVQSGKWKLLVVKGTGASGNDSLVFLAPVSTAKLPAAPRQLSLVRYGIESRAADTPSFGGWPEMPAFSRTARTFSWDDDLGAYLPFTESAANAALSGAEPQQIAPGVIRCEVCFQLWDGSIVAEEPADPAGIRAIICGIVAVDRQSVAKLSASERDSVASRFPKAGLHQRPLEAWRGSIEQLPPAVRKTIHVYEQTISI